LHHAEGLISSGIQPKAPGVLINSLQWRKWSFFWCKINKHQLFSQLWP